MEFPNVKYDDFLSYHNFRELKRPFYKANIVGFLEKDIDQERAICVREFDADEIPIPPFEDTAPEEVEKELLKDYLLPLLWRTEDNFLKETMKQYEVRAEINDSSILNFKERNLEYIEMLTSKTIEVKHLTAGLKKPILESLGRCLKFIDENIRTNFAEDYRQNKLKMRLNLKEICHLMLYLNEKGLFDQKYSKSQLAKHIEGHFESQVGTKDEFKTIVTAINSLSNSINRDTHHSYSPKLKDILVDYQKIMAPIIK